MRISLEQWRALVGVVDAGGYAQAAEQLHKSQSTISYAVRQIESALEVAVFEIRGRKAELTPAGRALVQRARLLVREAEHIENAARAMGQGYESEVHLASDIIVPTAVIFSAAEALAGLYPATRLQIHETVLGGTDEALLDGRADIALTPHIPQGFYGDPLMRLRFVAVAAPGHALFELGRPLKIADLRRHRHIVIRDTAQRQPREVSSFAADRRWTVSQMSSSIAAIESGHGFAWLPEAHIRPQLEQGRLKPLPLRRGGERYAQCYLVMADPDGAGPATERLVTELHAACRQLCPPDLAQQTEHDQHP